jgi:hypothetical protein
MEGLDLPCEFESAVIALLFHSSPGNLAPLGFFIDDPSIPQCNPMHWQHGGHSVGAGVSVRCLFPS